MSNKLNLIGAVTQALENELEADKRVVVYGEDVGLEGGVFRATVGLQEKFGEKRVFDSPPGRVGYSWNGNRYGYKWFKASG